MKKNNSYLTIGIIFFLTIYFFTSSNSISKNNYNYEVKIHRDNWGVPHIYGLTDEDAAYGLAYAHAEDDFETIQDILLVSRGMLASAKGKDSAPIDYLVDY